MNGNRQNGKIPNPYGNMRIPSVEERKVPYKAPPQQQPQKEDQQRQVNQHTQQFVPVQRQKKPEQNADEYELAPSMGYYPRAGRKRTASYGPSASDIEAFSMLALICAMIIFVIFVLCAYGGYVFMRATGVLDNPSAKKDTAIATQTAVSPLSESDYFENGNQTDFENAVPVSAPADDEYFKDAVFIGDSRTEGLWLYSKLKAEFICERGLNVMKTTEDKLDKYDGKTAFEVLSESDCTKIYISFGINELGWMTSAFEKTYSELIDKIKAAKPDAIIYVQNVYPMSKEQHDKNIYGDNVKVSEYNRIIAEMCREKEVYLLDVASYFADKDGHLKSSYETGVDGAHFKAGGQGYVDWTNYIRTHTVQP